MVIMNASTWRHGTRAPYRRPKPPTNQSVELTECERLRYEAHESERKTVHQWLNDALIPRKELGKPICLLRRLRIACDRLES